MPPTPVQDTGDPSVEGQAESDEVSAVPAVCQPSTQLYHLVC